MINRLLVISLIFLSLGSSAIVVTDEYLTTIENNWLSLEPDDAYDFIPEDLTYEMYMSEEFQAKLAAEGTRLNNSLEGKDIAPSFKWISLNEIKVFGIILLSGVLSGLIPAVMVFRKNLHQALS